MLHCLKGLGTLTGPEATRIIGLMNGAMNRIKTSIGQNRVQLYINGDGTVCCHHDKVFRAHHECFLRAFITGFQAGVWLQ